MKPNGMKRIWSNGAAVLNGWLSIANPFTAEIMASQGYDSITVDLQHGIVDYQTAVSMFQAMAASGITPIARVPWLGSGLINHSQKMTAAAMQIAEKKVWAQRS